ncbi:MAG: PAS domain S-box protein [Planctomycetes bacterium]|nr:PAS domain S-box protein [Planctomycetota bacterium]
MKTYDVAELAQTLFEEAGDALFLFDPESEQILETNPMASRLTGFSRQQMLRLKVTYLFRSEVSGGIQRLRAAFRKTGLFHSQDGFFLRQNDGARWVAVNLSITRLHTEQEPLGLITARDVREQREAQAQLRKKEEQLRRVLSSVSDCLWSVEFNRQTGNWKMVYISPVVEAITGRPPSFFATLDRLYQIIHPDDLARVKLSHQRMLTELSHSEDDYRIIRPDETVRWVRASKQTHRGEEGSLRVDSVMSDITERVEAEERLRRNERQYRDLVETSNDLIWAVDESGAWTFVNRKAALAIYGLEPEEMIGRPFTDFLSPGLLERDLATFGRIKAGESIFQYETVHLRKDGTPVDLSFNAIVQKDEQGIVGGATGTATDISQRKKAEKALRESEERLHAFMDHSPALAFIKDEEGRYLFINRVFQARFQVRAEDFFGRSDDVLWPPKVAARLRDHDRRALEAKRPMEFLEQVATPDGVVRDWWVLKFPIQDASGRSLLGGLALDLTERRQAEEALRASEERYRLLFERNLAGVFRSSLDGRLLDCNESFARILGYSSPTDILSHRVGELYMEPTDRHELLSRLSENPILTNFELRMRRKDDTPLWILENVSLLQEADGDPILEGTIVDINDHKQALEALKASEAKYRVLIENLEQSIFLKDRDLRFVAANKNFCACVGLTEAEIVGKSDYDFYPVDLADKYRADDLQVMAEGRVLQIEEQNPQQEKMRTVRVIKTPVKDGNGKPMGVLGIFWDITDQVALEEQLRQVQKMDAIGQLAGGIAHDFNNLLTVILGNLSFVLGQKPVVADLAEEMLRNAEQAGVRAAELTQRLLGFSRRSMLRSEAVQLNRAAEETIRLLRRTIDPRIELMVETQPDCWPIKADPGMINQVLMNLCLNARDAMPQGGKLTLTTSHFVPDDKYLRTHVEAQPGEYVRLCVRDTGHGMTEEVRQRIFEPFFTTKGMGKGTGLGLAMVFGIVKQHRGWIVCESEVNRGTTFEVFLPRHIGEANATAIAGNGPVPFGNETILLVDDEGMIRNLGQSILRRFGYKVLLAEDGLKALEQCQRHGEDIDLVILDGTMPRLSGRDTLRKLAKQNPTLPVLFSSGYAAENQDLTGFPQIVGFIQKPYRVEDLGIKVREIFDKITSAPRNGT